MRSDSALVTARKQSYSYVRSLSEPVLLSQSSEDFLPFYSTDSEVSSYFSEYRHELVIVNTSFNFVTGSCGTLLSKTTITKCHKFMQSSLRLLNK